jgi:3-hydroxyacyl-CoA dehydrogenase/enoyl-CoA hydratase/3-hydroxybutyryl-CoA epimerase
MIDYQVDGDGIATITWNVPDRPVNVLNDDTMGAFSEAVQKAIGDDAVKGVIVASGKDDFVAGADLEAMLSHTDAERHFKTFSIMDPITRGMEKSGKPWVAAINGHALGGGFEIALGCHYRIAADNPKTLVGLPEVTLGLLPGGGGTQRIARMLGIRDGLPFLLEGKKHKVGKALDLGIIDEVVPADELLDRCRAWLKTEPDTVKPWDKRGFRIPGGNSQSPGGIQNFLGGVAMTRAKTYGNYPAPQAILSCVFEGTLVDIDTGLRLEKRYLTDMIVDPRNRAMLKTTFFGMNEARKLAGRPKGVDKRQFAKVGVLGAGMMGAGIGHVTAQRGMDVVLIDETQEAADKGRAHAKAQQAKLVERGRQSEDKAKAVVDRITATTDYDALAGADLVIEAVFENRDIKADVTKKAEAVMAADGVFASNTSTLPITGLAKVSQRPESFIGLHFFSPVERMPLVEVIRAEKTSDACLAHALDYVKAIGMTPIVVNDSRGFYTSRVFATYIMEGMAMVGEGVNPALIENAGKICGLPVGPLEVVDATSLSLSHAVRKQWQADLGDAYVVHPADDVIVKMVEELKRPGRKAGAGWYEYGEDGKRLWPGIGEHFPRAADQPDVEEVKNRLMHIQALETARCIEEGIISAADADIGSILGWGFPAWTGGTASYIGLMGADKVAAECETLAGKHGARFDPPSNLGTMAQAA